MDWADVYLAMKERAQAARGVVEINPETYDAESWPRTTGGDVLAIAAVLDPHVTSLRSFGSEHVVRRWRACVERLIAAAFDDPRDAVYVDNREFWGCVLVASTFLGSENAPGPDPQAFAGLVAELGGPLRNAGPSEDGPFGKFEGVKTFDDLFIAQFKYLRDLRGSDVKDAEPGMGGGTRVIPRSSNLDVTLLADYWGRQLDRARQVSGHAGVVAKWKAVMLDVEQLARPGVQSLTYAKNNAFWRVLATVAIQVAVADEAPSKWDLAVDAVKDSVVHLPETIRLGAEAAAQVVNDVAHGAGKVAGEVGRGLFAGFGTPLLIGGGLLGLFLLSRGKQAPPAPGGEG